jgi:hypothetical protein
MSPSGGVNWSSWQACLVIWDDELNQQARVARRWCHEDTHFLTLVVKKRRIGIVIMSQMFEYDFSWDHRFVRNKFIYAIWQRAFQYLWFDIE